MKDITPGSVWQHHSGRFYTVIALANDGPEPRERYYPTVVYMGPNGKWWAGLASDWHRRMTFVRQGPHPIMDIATP